MCYYFWLLQIRLHIVMPVARHLSDKLRAYLSCKKCQFHNYVNEQYIPCVTKNAVSL